MEYKKLPGNAGIEGVLFELNLLTVSLLNAMSQTGDWRLSTENEAGGKFDDVIFEHPSGSVLLQAKHRTNVSRNILLKDLLSANPTLKNDFCLAKYFFSYQEVKSKFKIRHVVICTDAVLKVEKNMINHPTTLPTDSVLHFENSGKLCYTFHDSIIPDLEKSINRYYETAKIENIGKDIISCETIKDFLNHLQFVSGYPSGKNLDKIIERKILQLKFRENMNPKMAREFIQKRMMDWFRQKKGIYLNSTRATAIFCEIVSNRYCESLEQHKIYFENDGIFTNTNYKIVHVVPREDDHLYIQKVYRELKDQSALIINPDQDDAVQNQILDSFQLPNYTHLIIVHTNKLLRYVKSICSKVKRTLEKDHWKKVILIAEKEYELAKHLKGCMKNEFCRINYDLRFTDLSTQTRDRILEKKVIFQGTTMVLGNLFMQTSTEELNRILNLDILSKLAKNEAVQFGQRVEAFKENLYNYYIFRTFERNGEAISEQELYTLYEKVTLIADSAGMGKSTALTSLANSIKKKHPNLWVVLLDLNKHTNVLRSIKARGGGTLTLSKLLNLSSFEEKIFSLPGKVVLLMDGIDEITPNYTDLVLNLIVDCKQRSNFRKIFLATRPHLCEKVEEKLNVRSFTLIPFSERDQINFMKKYWESELELHGEEAKKKCEIYATTLIRQMSKWMQERGRNAFTGIPLHLRMMAEVFQENGSYGDESETWEGCRPYIASSHHNQPTFPKRINFIELYKMFMNKKLNIFINDKSNPSATLFADEAIREKLKECNAQHYSLALEEIFDKQECKLFSCYDKNRNIDQQSLVKVGFVQRTNGHLNFVHRTFAEYFVAECIMNELKCKKHHERFPSFVVSKVLDSDEFYIVRAFLDNLLQKELSSLPRETLKAFHRIDYDAIMRNSTVNKKKVNFFLSVVNPQTTFLHILCHEGRSEILRFLFECLDFHKSWFIFPITKKKKIDIEARDDFGRTALLIATENGYLDIIRMLLERGADINRTQYDKIPIHKLHKFPKIFRIKKKGSKMPDTDNMRIDEYGGYPSKRRSFMVAQVRDIGTFTPLHLAADRGNLQTVQFLVENGADVDIQDYNGRTALHVAVRKTNTEVAYFLAKKCGDVNVQDVRGRTALHEAARAGDMSVYMLLVILGARDLIRDKNGYTPLDEVGDAMSEVERTEAEAFLDLERSYQFSYCISIDHHTQKKKIKRKGKIKIEHYKKIKIYAFLCQRGA